MITKVTLSGGSITLVSAAKKRAGFLIQNISETADVFLAMEGTLDFTDGDGAKPGFKLAPDQHILIGFAGDNDYRASVGPVFPLNAVIHGTVASGTPVGTAIITIQEWVE